MHMHMYMYPSPTPRTRLQSERRSEAGTSGGRWRKIVLGDVLAEHKVPLLKCGSNTARQRRAAGEEEGG